MLTGVTGLAELVAAPAGAAADVRRRGPGRPARAAPRAGRDEDAGGARAAGAPRVDDGRLGVAGDGRRRRLVAGGGAAAWEHLDDVGEPVDTGGRRARAAAR